MEQDQLPRFGGLRHRALQPGLLLGEGGSGGKGTLGELRVDEEQVHRAEDHVVVLVGSRRELTRHTATRQAEVGQVVGDRPVAVIVVSGGGKEPVHRTLPAVAVRPGRDAGKELAEELPHHEVVLVGARHRRRSGVQVVADGGHRVGLPSGDEVGQAVLAAVVAPVVADHGDGEWRPARRCVGRVRTLSAADDAEQAEHSEACRQQHPPLRRARSGRSSTTARVHGRTVCSAPLGAIVPVDPSCGGEGLHATRLVSGSVPRRARTRHEISAPVPADSDQRCHTRT